MTNPSNQYTVTVYVDKEAACLAGYDLHGKIERTVKPSELTERHRQTLVYCRFILSEHNTGVKIDGTQSLTELLDLASYKIDADKAKRAAEDAACIERMTRKLLDAPLSDTVQIDDATGTVNVERHEQTALVCIPDRLLSIQRTWLDPYGIWYSPASGNEARAKAIRAAVLSVPEVVERIEQADREAERLRDLLTKAVSTRKAISEQKRVENERIEAEQREAKRQYRADFVMEHMHETARKRFEAGLMPNSEIDAAIEAHAFAPFDEKHHWIGSIEAEVSTDEVIDYVRAESGNDYIGGPVLHVIRPLESCSDAQFLTIERMKSILPNAAFAPVEIAYYCEDLGEKDDPEYRIIALEVNLVVGPFEFTRLYRVDVQPTDGSGAVEG